MPPRRRSSSSAPTLRIPLLLLLLLLPTAAASCRRAQAPPTAGDEAPAPLVLDVGLPPDATAPDAAADVAADATPAPETTDPREELTARTYDVVLRDAVVYRATTAGVVIEDVSRPESPRRLGIAHLPGSINALAWLGRIERPHATGCPALPDGGDGCPPSPPVTVVAAAAGAEGVFLLDVADPANPVELARIDTPGAAMALAVGYPVLYVADGTNGVVAINVADPGRPRLTGGWTGELGGEASDGPCAPAPGRDGGCVSPVAPDPLAAPYARDVAFAPGRLWVAAGPAGVVALDVVDPLGVTGPPRLVPRGVFDTPGDARAVAVDGDLLFVADGAGGLRLARIGVAATLATEIAAWPTRDVCRDVELDASRDKSVFPPAALLAIGDRGLEVVDIADPSAPRRLGGHEARRPVNRVTIGPNGLIFLANDAAGLRIVDISVPAEIRVVFPET